MMIVLFLTDGPVIFVFKSQFLQTMLELSEKLELKKDQVEQRVGENKSDEMSAMYNMLLDTKRRDQGK